MDTGLAFVAFSLVASSIYVLNDLVDLERDKLHPVKQSRPLASGAISRTQALIIFATLLALAGGLGFFIKPWLLVILGSYFGMNLLYSFWLKHVAIIDIALIATGFVLRIFAGGVSADVAISKWLILLTFLLALILALAKRRGEFVNQNGANQTRKVLSGYNLAFIDVSLIMSATITVVCYIMYTVSEEVITRLDNQYVYLTTIFVILGIFRYIQQTLVFNRTESPTTVLFKDHFIQLVLVGWIAAFVLILYGDKWFG